MRAVVFGYHNVGVRCLRVLAAGGVDVALVVTHRDSPSENIWFESMHDCALELGIPVIAPDDPNDPELLEALAHAQAEALFSFYYRHMLPLELLESMPRGAYNMHGSLLPKYRGRVPVNWAIIKGERETGATLHEMVAKPDAGAILAQSAVPILPDDTALEVFNKVTVAAEQALAGVLPRLIDGTAARLPNDLGRGSYFGGRRPEDGRIDWNRPAAEVYNLVRAVAPPYPGAFTEIAGTRVVISAARLARDGGAGAGAGGGDLEPGLKVRDNHVFGVCGDGRALLILRLLRDGAPITPADLRVLLTTP